MGGCDPVGLKESSMDSVNVTIFAHQLGIQRPVRFSRKLWRTLVQSPPTTPAGERDRITAILEAMRDAREVPLQDPPGSRHFILRDGRWALSLKALDLGDGLLITDPDEAREIVKNQEVNDAR